MSYEGTDYFLCEAGHLSAFDAYDESDKDMGCKRLVNPDRGVWAPRLCRRKFVWTQSVDETNGLDPGNPDTFLTKLRVVRNEDCWHKDHYGNVYAVYNECFEIPEGGPGRRL